MANERNFWGLGLISSGILLSRLDQVKKGVESLLGNDGKRNSVFFDQEI